MSSDTRIEHLSFSGKVCNKITPPDENGLISTLKNFVVKNHIWKFLEVAFHCHSGDFIGADERGQLYSFSVRENTYESLRCASFPIGALECIHSHASQVLVAYRNGLVIIVDMLSKEITANLRPRGSSPVVIMKCCPTKPLAVLVTENGQMILWNLSTLVAMETMQCKEPVVDISFLLLAKYLAVTFAHSGSIVYDLSTLQVVMKCVTPPGERKPRLWTSFCSTVSPHTGGAHPSYTVPCGKEKFVFLSGDNGSIYMFELKGIPDGPAAIPTCPMTGVIELPPHITMAVSMTIVTPRHVASALSPHVFLIVLGNNGEIILLDGCITFSDSWQWCVLHAFVPFQSPERPLQSRSISLESIQLEPKICATASTSGMSLRRDAIPYCLASCSIEMESAHYAIIDNEGSINLYDWNAFMDKHIVMSEMGEMKSVQGDKWFHEHKWLNSRGQRTQPIASHREVQLSVDTSPEEESISGSGVSPGPQSSSHDLSFLSPKKMGSSNVNGLTFSALNKKRCKSDIAKEQSEGSPRKVLPQAERKPHTTVESEKKTKASKNVRINDREKPSISMILDSSTQKKTLNPSKLKKFLKKYGQYPAEHRTLIWRVLLQLPENEKSFAGLVSRGTHENYENLYDQYPIRERRVFKRLQGICSHLAHWNAVFGDVEYIPQLVLPFVVMFASDELSALETVMTVLVWWGRSWQATFPNPPVHITDTLDVLLDKHDANLRAHFYALHAPPGIIAWKLLSTLFSELVPSTEWQILMDHLFTHVEEYYLLYLVPIALMKLLRPSLLSATSSRQIISFLRQPQTIDVERLFIILHHLKSETSSHLLSACFTGIPNLDEESADSKISNEKKQKSIGLNLSSGDRDLGNARGSIGAQEGEPTFPLPRGGYPTFDGYPPHLLDWQSKERAMALSMKKEIRDNESCLHELQQKLALVEDNHNMWMQTQKGLEEKELKERKQFLEKDRKHLSELSVIEEKIARQRIENLYKIEEMERKELEAIEETKNKVKNLVEMSGKHMKEKVDQVITSQEHREAGEEADRVLQSKIQALYMNKRKENMLRETESALRLKQEVLESGNRLKIATWQQEDKAAKMNRLQLSEQAKHKMYQQLMINQKREIDEQAKLLVLEREAKLLDIERLRTLRSIKEEHSSRVYETKEEELTSQEEIMKHALSDVEDVNAGESNMQELMTFAEIRGPREELFSISKGMESSNLMSEEAKLKAAMDAMQRDHETNMQEFKEKKEKLIATKAQSLEETVNTARNFVHNQEAHLTSATTASSLFETKLKGQTLSKNNEHVKSTSSSVASDDSDALFHKALQFVNKQTSPGADGKVDINENVDGGSVSEDMIISALEIISKNDATSPRSEKSGNVTQSAHSRESKKDQPAVGNIESLVTAELTDMLSIASSESNPSFQDDIQHEHFHRRQKQQNQKHSLDKRGEKKLEIKELQQYEERIENPDIRYRVESETRTTQHQQSTAASEQYVTTKTIHQEEGADVDVEGQQRVANNSMTSETSSKSLEVLETIAARAYRDVQFYDEDSLQPYTNERVLAMSKSYTTEQNDGVSSKSNLADSSGSSHSASSSSSSGQISGSQQSSKIHSLATEEALWAYTVSGREEFKDLASEFSEDELNVNSD